MQFRRALRGPNQPLRLVVTLPLIELLDRWRMRCLSLCVVLATLLLSGRASASTAEVSVNLGGAQEVPPNASTATGTCAVQIDLASSRLTFNGTFSGLSAPATGASVRGPATATTVGPSVAVQTAITADVTGTFSGSAIAAPQVASEFLSGALYCEVDDQAIPAGEIRGQLAGGFVVPAMGGAAVALLVGALVAAGALAARANSRGGPRNQVTASSRA